MKIPPFCRANARTAATCAIAALGLVVRAGAGNTALVVSGAPDEIKLVKGPGYKIGPNSNVRVNLVDGPNQ